MNKTHSSHGFEEKVVYDVDYRHECCIIRVKYEVVIESIVVGGHESQLERRNYCLERPESRLCVILYLNEGSKTYQTISGTQMM
jgi:hypothetical protein